MSRPPHFIAFYSYRGGVGRTTALCNVAARMILQGDRVLVVDLDLQAPGATLILGGAAASTNVGLVELMHTKEGEVPLSPASVVQQLMLGERPFWLLSAGRLDDTYPERAEAVDPAKLTMERVEVLFRQLREFIVSSNEHWHYVLIDCRPGLTSTGLATVSVLADSVALLFGLNRQTLHGIGWVRKKFATLDKIVHLIAAQVPDRDEIRESLAEAESAWDESIKVQLHFDDALAMNERIYLAPADRPLVQDYDKLTAALRMSPDVYSLVEQSKRLLVEPGQVAVAQTRLQEALQADSSDPRARIAMANLYLVRGNLEKSLEQLEKVVETAADQKDFWQVADALSEKAPSNLLPSIDSLYKAAPSGAATSVQRVALARFSTRIQEIMSSDADGEALSKNILDALREAAQAAGTDDDYWSGLLRRLPTTSRFAEERQDLADWLNRVARAGGALLPLTALIQLRLDQRSRGLPGVVKRFGHLGYGFLETFDGQGDVYFERSDCLDYGSDPADYIAVGETAFFDLEYRKERGWHARNVQFPVHANPPGESTSD